MLESIGTGKGVGHRVRFLSYLGRFAFHAQDSYGLVRGFDFSEVFMDGS